MTEPEGLAFTFSVNYSLRAGNQDRSDLGAGSRLDYKAGRHYVFLLGNLNYGISQGVTYKNRSFAHLRYNYALKPAVVGELFGQLENDPFTLLQIRLLVGMGARLRYLSGEHLALFQGSGLMLEHEALDANKVIVHPSEITALRWNNYLNARLQLDEHVSFFNTLYVQPRLDEFGDIRLLLDSGITVNLNDHVAITTTLNLRYDSRPPDTIASFDLELKNGLRLAF
jgi:putative salt-induced outer membrane protein YdiY